MSWETEMKEIHQLLYQIAGSLKKVQKNMQAGSFEFVTMPGNKQPKEEQHGLARRIWRHQKPA